VFLKLLRAERRAAGLTQKELAKKLKETQAFVSKCERGERRLDTIETRRFCIAMGGHYSVFVAKLETAIEESVPSKKLAARR
jgi:transcriptional regulator with XRE-family HTH domain